MMLLCKARPLQPGLHRSVCPRRVATTDPGGCSPCSYRKRCPADRFYSSYRSGRLREITGFTLGVFKNALKKRCRSFDYALVKWLCPRCPAISPFERLLREDTQKSIILRKAVVFIHAPRTSRFGYQDANLAYQNASLMAECLGVSQFYTGFVCSAIEQDKKGHWKRNWGSMEKYMPEWLWECPLSVIKLYRPEGFESK